MKQEARILRLFPNEKIKHIANGVKSAVFLTESGKIIRTKLFIFGTYSKEARILNSIRDGGGIDCNIPKLSVFCKGLYAYSVHDNIKGSNLNQINFSELNSKQQELFAHQLAKSLIKLYNIKPGINITRKLFERPIFSSIFQYFKYYFYIRRYINKKNLLRNYIKLCKNVFKNKNLGLIHGDLHRYNIIIDDDFNLSGIIDFDGVRLGHFEHNLRKLDQPIQDYVVRYYNNHSSKKINIKIMNYYRMIVLIKRIKRTKNMPYKAVLISELESLF